jgi:thiosulfate dehydrogenase (quinone) large subunit
MTTATHAPSHHAISIPAVSAATATRYVWATARIALGFVFLWAFLDKTFGLGHDTISKQAWIHGGSPTQGFLKFGAKGPFTGFYHSIAGAGWADVLFMAGLAGIGVALILGVGMRIAAGAGTLMLLMMWSVALPPASNLFLDDHLIYALLIVGLALSAAGDTLGLGRWWSSTSLVKRLPVLK